MGDLFIKKYLKWLSFIVSLLIVYFLLREIGVEDIKILLAYIKIPLLAAAFFMYLAASGGKAHRFYFLLGKKISFAKLVNITFAYASITTILPARTGEFSYLYYNY